MNRRLVVLMIGALVAILSLDMTRKMVANGLVSQTKSIASVSNTSPIIVTTATPHKWPLGRQYHGVIDGVGGTTEANGLWAMVPTGASTLRLFSYDMDGTQVPSIGNGAYTSGGTLRTAFPEGSILLGRRNVAMMGAPAAPRIVFVPTATPGWDLEPYGGVIPPGTLPRARANETSEQQFMLLHRQLATEHTRFEVHVTGSAVPADPDYGDIDATQALYHSLYESMFRLMTPDRARVIGGVWASQDEDIQTLNTHGQKWVGVVEIMQPVTDASLTFVPSDISAEIAVSPVNGTSGDTTIIVIE
jgi:hypothetical protein